MARTGQDEASAANKDTTAQQKEAYATGQESVNAGKSALATLLQGKDIAKNPFQNPGYLSNVNRLQANSLDASQEAANADMEAANKRTGGLNSGATAGAEKDLALQKMRLADQLSAERSANDYRSNLTYQQQQLQNLWTPAQLESGYYGTSTSGRSAAVGDLTQFGLASYGPWQSAIQAAGGAGAAALKKG